MQGNILSALAILAVGISTALQGCGGGGTTPAPTTPAPVVTDTKSFCSPTKKKCMTPSALSCASDPTHACANNKDGYTICDDLTNYCVKPGADCTPPTACKVTEYCSPQGKTCLTPDPSKTCKGGDILNCNGTKFPVCSLVTSLCCSTQNTACESPCTTSGLAQACPAPAETFPSKGKDCPSNLPYNCLNSNIGYKTFSAAWDQCGKVNGCGFIMKYYRDGKFYLRRITDPDNDQSQGVAYTCQAAPSPSPSPSPGGAACSSVQQPSNPCTLYCSGEEDYVKNVNGGTSCCSAWTGGLAGALCGTSDPSVADMCTMIRACSGCTQYWPSALVSLVDQYKSQCGFASTSVNRTEFAKAVKKAGLTGSLASVKGKTFKTNVEKTTEVA